MEVVEDVVDGFDVVGTWFVGMDVDGFDVL